MANPTGKNQYTGKGSKADREARQMEKFREQFKGMPKVLPPLSSYASAKPAKPKKVKVGPGQVAIKDASGKVVGAMSQKRAKSIFNNRYN